ncbi:hypothetical protein CERSUDRAFT_140279 [Gelatoporia subvermispora B]|uniref:Protein kinase domain-containing protein n=1 Tax=Ceriporiopsis subvermispora (strain B) TaxID=914234 RepID=M2QCD8_CERS8|nr:hypothetical protein CERSUDRAFT_140279 [Gelatoporia subvermispora B]
MVATPKRSASASPDDPRPSKRHVPSSPEEGELDDATPPQPKPARSPTPVKAAGKPPVRIPFPFKKKPTAVEERPSVPSNGAPKPPLGPMVYERSEEDERRFREEEERKHSYSRPRHPPQHSVDRWQPAAGRYDNGGSWNHADVRSTSHYTRERDGHDDRRYRPMSPHRERRTISRSPSRSSYRSRSPLSPPSNKEKHRLPPPRSSVAPLGDYYDDRGARDRRPRSPDRAYDRSRSTRRDGYDDDRYYRPQESSRDSRDDRRWERRRSSSSTRRYEGRYEADTYRPVSPRLSTPQGPPSPRSPARLPERPRSREPLPPRPPSVGPAPPPSESQKEADLIAEHTAIKTPLPKKPPTPVNVHSPPSMSIPPPKTGTVPHAPESRERTRTNGSVEPQQVIHRHKRRAKLRSRGEEERLYGRVFFGCGRQDDYDVLTKLGEGTFGEVHKAVHRVKGNAVALKRILMHNEKEGMPVTALREIKILKALHHPCVVDILDMFVVRSQGKDAPLSVYMVFPYMDHDLAGLLENERVKLSPSQIKLYMKQLLEGTEYMHRNHIIHRDMKAANLLISNTGSLKIADFGLARAFDPSITRGGEDFRGRERKYTNCVVTRWYRPPELLLGARQYGGEIDLWGIGCVLGEMFWRRPILPGTTDVDQLEKIWQLCGTPNQHTWPNHDQLPGCEGVKRFNQYPRRVKQVYEMIGAETLDLLDKLLVCNPRDRITASQALDHDYFWTDPLPADPKTLPSYEASHEFDKRGRRNQAPVGPPIPQPHMDGPPRQLPMPMVQPPMPYGRPPPPREAFRTGPRPPYQPGPPGLPPPSYPTYHHHPPPAGYPGPHQPRYPSGGFLQGPPPAAGLPPATLPPITLRPGQPPPQIWQPPSGRPSHLPARPPPMPPMAMGRGPGPNNREHQRREPGNGAGDLNYG